MKRFTKRVGGYYRLKLAIQNLQRILKRRANFVKIGILPKESKLLFTKTKKIRIFYFLVV